MRFRISIIYKVGYIAGSVGIKEFNLEEEYEDSFGLKRRMDHIAKCGISFSVDKNGKLVCWQLLPDNILSLNAEEL